MTINNFNGNCFVAFIDISGFKKMMKDGNKAKESMIEFYSNGYKLLYKYSNNVNGLFISDCGILFSINKNKNKMDQLSDILNIVKEINIGMLEKNVMLTTSLAYGEFSIMRNLEFDGIGKNPIYGDAYISAYTDNENGNPKIKPGQCRIVNKDVSTEDIKTDFQPYIEKNKEHYYYYWNLDKPEHKSIFLMEYDECYNIQYKEMLNVLKKYSINNNNTINN